MTRALGRNAQRSDGVAKVRGTAVYGMDYEPAGMLHAALLRSPLAAGRIVSVDASEAASIPGVRAAVTAADVPATSSGWIIKDQPLFARDEVRYLGEPIAAVAASSLELARRALDAIRLRIERFEPIVELEDALAEGGRLVHREWERHVVPEGGRRAGNVAWENALERGDVDACFARADTIVEDEFRVGRQHQCPIEPHVAVAEHLDGRFTVHTPAQYPFLVRDRVAELLDVAPSRVRVVVPTIGGGFGSKLDAMLEPYACVLAQRSGRPVRLLNSREEELTTAGPRENAVVRLRTAVSETGEILAQAGDILIDNGAYSGETVACASDIPLILGGAYRVPACRYRVRTVYTNTTPTAAFRGVAGPYTVFAREQHMDHIARRLKIDRRELRLRNLLRKGEAMANGQVLEDAALAEAFERLEELAPWPRGGSVDGRRSGRTLRGVGLAPLVWMTNPGPGAATVKLNEDGTVTVVSAGAEIGTGAMTTGVRQLVADEIGIPVDAVAVTQPDTDAAGYDAGAQGSRTTFGIGAAARDAAAQVRRRALDVASGMLEAAAEDLELQDGRVTVVGSPDAGLPLAAVAATATWTVGPIAASGTHVPPAVPFDGGCLTGALETGLAAASYHAHLCEVEVDADTGHVSIVRYAVVQDVGRIVNPQMIEGQIHGGVVQGLGYALYESLRTEEGGVIDDQLETYRLPTAYEAPPIAVSLMEVPCPYGPLGVKGVGEPPIIPVAAAVAGAVTDAIGQPIHTLPITPFEVLRALAR